MYTRWLVKGRGHLCSHHGVTFTLGDLVRGVREQEEPRDSSPTGPVCASCGSLVIRTQPPLRIACAAIMNL